MRRGRERERERERGRNRESTKKKFAVGGCGKRKLFEEKRSVNCTPACE